MKKSTFNTKYFVIASLIGLMSGPATSAVPHTFASGGVIKSSEMNANFTAIDNAISNIPLTPVGASVGDIMYWDGSVWQLTPAPPACSGDHADLKLISGVPTWTCPGVNYVIGDVGPAGGIVFYTTDGGLHGLEAAPADQSAAAAWGCSGVSIAGAAGTAIGTGAANTAAIVAGCADAGTAAKVADAYTLNGVANWYLPSRDELNQLNRKKYIVGGFADVVYWSSSENDSNTAWYQGFNDGNPGLINKFSTFRVRAVRAF